MLSREPSTCPCVLNWKCPHVLSFETLPNPCVCAGNIFGMTVTVSAGVSVTGPLAVATVS